MFTFKTQVNLILQCAVKGYSVWNYELTYTLHKKICHERKDSDKLSNFTKKRSWYTWDSAPAFWTSLTDSSFAVLKHTVLLRIRVFCWYWRCWQLCLSVFKSSSLFVKAVIYPKSGPLPTKTYFSFQDRNFIAKITTIWSSKAWDYCLK